MPGKWTLCCGIAALLAAAPAFAASINSIETTVASGTLGTVIGDAPNTAVIDYIASAPGTVDGYTYTKYALIAADASGSLEVYGAIPAGNTYTPAVGDAITATGMYSPYDGIPELETLTAISQVSSGNAVASPIAVTVADLQAAAVSTNYGLSEYLVTLSGITLSGATTFATHGNTTLTGTDSSGNSLEVYQWASSYSASAAFGGMPVPTGPVDITGIFDSYDSSPEFIPFTITASATPEPASLGLLTLGAVAMLSRRRRKA